MAEDHPPTRRVFILGAGANQCLTDWDGRKPPMSRNFLRTYLANEWRRARIRRPAGRWQHVAMVLEFIENVCNVTEDQLSHIDFDLESFLTFLQMQMEGSDAATRDSILDVFWGTMEILAEDLSEGAWEWKGEHVMRGLATRILAGQSAIISFNYDTLLEDSLERASGYAPIFRRPAEGTPVSREMIDHSLYRWNRARAYGFKFDEVTLQFAGPQIVVPGSEFYAGTSLYDAPVLKLHGSLNWFRHTSIAMPSAHGQHAARNPKENQILLQHRPLGHRPPEIDGWRSEPVVVPASNLKERFLGSSPFREIWGQAHRELRSASEIVVIGYSFPQTDGAARDLFRDARRDLRCQKLVVVNPDPKACATAAEIIGHESLEQFDDMAQYLDS